mmetsp:Transcript_47462/g.69556  ORF Transcript_47462/g.69556 Transcript_47462/m.69556 type:complete len:208 (-) Transcript_47462:1429-2052(-)
MVGRFVQQQNVSLHEHTPRERHLHFPSTRQGSYLLGEHFVVKSNRAKPSFNHSPIRATTVCQLLIIHQKVDDEQVSVLALNVVLNIGCANLVGRREALDLLVDNGAHQRGFAAAVGTNEGISLASLHVQASVGEEHQCAVAQREFNVAQVLALLIQILLRNLDARGFETHLAQLIACLRRALVQGLKNRLKHLRPRILFEIAIAHHH